jgi:hypothetical protein
MWIPNDSRLRIDGGDYNFRRRDEGPLLVDDAGTAFTLRDPAGGTIIPREDMVVELFVAGRALLLPSRQTQPPRYAPGARLAQTVRRIETSGADGDATADRSDPIPVLETGRAASDRSRRLERADEILNAAAALTLVDPGITVTIAYRLYRREMRALDLDEGEGGAIPADVRCFRRRVRLAEFVAEEALSGNLDRPRRGPIIIH